MWFKKNWIWVRHQCIIKLQKTKFRSFVTLLSVAWALRRGPSDQTLIPLEADWFQPSVLRRSSSLRLAFLLKKKKVVKVAIGHIVLGLLQQHPHAGSGFHQHSILYLFCIQAEVILQGTLYLSPDVGSGGSSRAGLGPECQRSGRRVPRCSVRSKIPGSRQAAEEQLVVKKQDYLNTQNLIKVRVEWCWLIHLGRLHICIFIQRYHLNTHTQIS